MGGTHALTFFLVLVSPLQGECERVSATEGRVTVYAPLIQLL